MTCFGGSVGNEHTHLRKISRQSMNLASPRLSGESASLHQHNSQHRFGLRSYCLALPRLVRCHVGQRRVLVPQGYQDPAIRAGTQQHLGTQMLRPPRIATNGHQSHRKLSRLGRQRCEGRGLEGEGGGQRATGMRKVAFYRLPSMRSSRGGGGEG